MLCGFASDSYCFNNRQIDFSLDFPPDCRLLGSHSPQFVQVVLNICILPRSAVQRSTRYVLLFDVFVIMICLASLILCTRSIVLALRLRKVSVALPFLPPLSLQPAFVQVKGSTGSAGSAGFIRSARSAGTGLGCPFSIHLLYCPEEQEEEAVGANIIDQLEKCSPHKPRDLRLIPSTHITKPDRTVYVCNSSSGVVDRRVLRLNGQSA